MKTDLFVPTRLQERASSDFGTEGSEWLAELPARVTRLEQDWSLEIGRGLDTDAYCSWIAPVRLSDGSEAILKVQIPHREARREADALRVFDGRGAVRLLQVSEDGFMMLLERCVPGMDLWSLGEEEGDAVAAGVLRRLWRETDPGAPFESVSDIAAEWQESIPREGADAGYDADLVNRAVELARELSESQPKTVLLHGDFHPSNVLSAARESWLVIDPKPLVGEPAYDLAQWLGNRYDAALLSPDPVSMLRRQCDRMSRLLDLDRDRVAGWAFVKSLGWDWGPESARLFRAAMAA